MGFCLFLLCLPASPHQASLVAFWSHPAILGGTEAPRGAEILGKGLSHEVLQLSCFHFVLRVQRPILGASQWGSSPLQMRLPSVLTFFSTLLKHLDPCLWLLCPFSGQHPHLSSCLPMGGCSWGPTSRWEESGLFQFIIQKHCRTDPSQVPKVARTRPPTAVCPFRQREGLAPHRWTDLGFTVQGQC